MRYNEMILNEKEAMKNEISPSTQQTNYEMKNSFNEMMHCNYRLFAFYFYSANWNLLPSAAFFISTQMKVNTNKWMKNNAAERNILSFVEINES